MNVYNEALNPFRKVDTEEDMTVQSLQINRTRLKSLLRTE